METLGSLLLLRQFQVLSVHLLSNYGYEFDPIVISG
jgi:hypothetical protein